MRHFFYHVKTLQKTLVEDSTNNTYQYDRFFRSTR